MTTTSRINRLLHLFTAAAACGSLGLALTGCGVASVSGDGIGKRLGTNSTTIEGQVHGGQQPIVGTHVAMYAAGTSGYGLQAQSLLAAPGYVLTDANGNFSLTGTYTCPTNSDGSSALVYLVATGGDPGMGANNPALGLMAALGNCTTLQNNAATTFINLNEVTTAASAFALSGFISSPTQVSSSSTTTGIRGLTDAFASANELANTSTGTANAAIPQGTATAPQAKLNAAANALAACVNSGGGTGTNQPCGTLFTATAINGVAPADTVQAAINIAHAPGQNVTKIFNLQSSISPFAPVPANAPNDWTMPLTFTGNGISAPQAVALDAFGQAYVADKTNTLQLFVVGGAVISYTDASFDAPSSIAVSTSGNVYVANCGNSCSASGKASSITQFSIFGDQKYTGGGLNAAYAIAGDGSGNLWTANTFGNSVSKFSSTGAAQSPATTGYNAAGLSYPVALAFDTGGNAWVTNPPSNSVVKLNSTGVAQSGTGGYTGSGLNYPYAVAIDASGNAWVANHGASSVVVLNASGVAQSGTAGYTGAGLNLPNAIALDGAGRAWLTNSNNSISVLSSTGAAVSGTTGYLPGVNHGNGIAVDSSGNVWVTSCGSVCSGGTADPGSVVELIGAATPVLTPISAGAAGNKLASLP